MRLVAVSQSVAVAASSGERRDYLDQAWTRFLGACGFVPMLLPNDADTARFLCAAVPICGILLTGGNDLAAYGGDAPERDAAETALIDLAEDKGWPVLGVCRGMQVIQHRFGVRLARVADHVAPRKVIAIEGEPVAVNSYHNFGAAETWSPLEAWAVAMDGVVKAVRYPARRIVGIMWHPERLDPFAERDITLFQRVFGER
jgi:N5-(cytidine 5'-diphosphoramidyl)-L-glutamine hydrolase